MDQLLSRLVARKGVPAPRVLVEPRQLVGRLHSALGGLEAGECRPRFIGKAAEKALGIAVVAHHSSEERLAKLESGKSNLERRTPSLDGSTDRTAPGFIGACYVHLVPGQPSKELDKSGARGRMLVDGIECGVDARVLHVPLLLASCHQLLCGVTMVHEHGHLHTDSSEPLSQAARHAVV